VTHCQITRDIACAEGENVLCSWVGRWSVLCARSWRHCPILQHLSIPACEVQSSLKVSVPPHVKRHLFINTFNLRAHTLMMMCVKLKALYQQLYVNLKTNSRYQKRISSAEQVQYL